MSSVSASGSSLPHLRSGGFCPAWWAVRDGEDGPRRRPLGGGEQQDAQKSSSKLRGEMATLYSQALLPRPAAAGSGLLTAPPWPPAWVRGLLSWSLQGLGCQGLEMPKQEAARGNWVGHLPGSRELRPQVSALSEK